jgi:hypothetical protein
MCTFCVVPLPVDASAVVSPRASWRKFRIYGTKASKKSHFLDKM